MRIEIHTHRTKRTAIALSGQKLASLVHNATDSNELRCERQTRSCVKVEIRGQGFAAVRLMETYIDHLGDFGAEQELIMISKSVVVILA